MTGGWYTAGSIRERVDLACQFTASRFCYQGLISVPYISAMPLLLIDKSFFMTNFCSAFPKNLTTVSSIRNTNFQDLDTCIVFSLFLVPFDYTYSALLQAYSLFVTCQSRSTICYNNNNNIAFCPKRVGVG